MSIYQRQGCVPHKRHTVFRKPNGELYHEELFGTEGFSSTSSLMYHLHPPTRVKGVVDLGDKRPEIAIDNSLLAMSFLGWDVPAEADYLDSRKVFFTNDDLNLGLACPSESMHHYFFKNGDSDEMLFVHKGSGTLKTAFGNLSFSYGDYLIIPRGISYQLHFDGPDNKLLFLESHSPIQTPKRYRNSVGQYLEHSPFCERDFRAPEGMETHDEEGDFVVKILKRGKLFAYTYANHPFDLIGWDGYHYPYAFSIFDFEPITGRVHMPPPIHQQFEGRNFVVCSFVPRLYDYHPEAIPAPYHHSNIDAEEILYYVDGDFMSRNNIQKGQFTLHPAGIPHGPHPGAIERSIGKTSTEELAVMIDPFNPLKITKEAMKYQVAEYEHSWM